MRDRTSFSLPYAGSDLVFGRGVVATLGDYLDEHGIGSVLLVCGSGTGANTALMGPLRTALGKRVAGVFDGVQADKAIESVFRGVDALRDARAEAVIGVGGGASLDTARQISVFAAAGRPIEDYRDAARAGAPEEPVPQTDAASVLLVPTTLAGADLSTRGSIQVLSAGDSPTGMPVRSSGQVTPTAVFYDPALFEATPLQPLIGSSLNGFNKGVEGLYARARNPLREAAAVRGLALMGRGLPHLADGDAAAFDQVVEGLILVQLHRQVSVIHAFARGFARQLIVHQGLMHAAVGPAALRYVLDHVDVDLELFAAAFDLDASAPSPGLVVDAYTALRDRLGLPGRIRDVVGDAQVDIDRTAEYVCSDGIMKNAPADLPLSPDAVAEVLRSAW